MKTFNATQLSQKPADVFAAAREDGAIIQQKRTNGEVIEEFVIMNAKHWIKLTESLQETLKTLQS